MHAQYRYQLRITNNPKHYNKYYIASYHEIMEYLVGTSMKRFSLIVVFFALLGLTTVQIIATSSNFYILYPTISKRSWSIIVGFLFCGIAFVRTFRSYRLLSIFGIVTTTYTAWYMMIASIQNYDTQHEQDDIIYEYVKSSSFSPCISMSLSFLTYLHILCLCLHHRRTW